ncbi:MAG: hypothetical protein ABSA97_11035 [Verrucomicrobiia bacterium]
MQMPEGRGETLSPNTLEIVIVIKMAESRPPASPQEGSLPFYDPAFSWDTFESFFCDFLASGPKLVTEENGQRAERQVINARPYGRRGDSQHGIDIKADMEDGKVWAFQCKHYKEWGRSDTAEAIAKCAYVADRKFLLVTREVAEECYREVERNPGWTLWDSRAISREFLQRCDREKAARILYLHFGQGWDTKLLGLRGDGPLLTPDAKFEPLRREGRYFHHRLALIGREKWLSDLDSFGSSRAQVLLLTGRGGLGKSRLLARWSEGFTQRHQDVVLRFLSDRPGEFGSVLDALGGNAVIVFDDAHRLPEIRRALFPEFPNRRKLKLVVSLRPGALRSVYQELLDAGFDTTDITEAKELGPLTPEQAMELAQAALGPALADRYATFLAQVSKECPLIAILGGELLQRGNISPAELANTQDFQTRVFDGLLREAQPVEDAFGKTAVDDILQMLALLAPVQPTADFKERVARLLGSPWTGDRVSKVLDALNDAGLLLVTGAGVRVTPDLLSDHLAYKACYDRQGKASGFAARLIEEFSPEQFPVMLQHLTEAEWRAVQEHDSTDSVVEPLWQWFSQRFQGSSFYMRRQQLEEWTQVAPLQPARTLELARLAIRLIDAPALSPPAFHVPELDSYQGVLEKVSELLKAVAQYHAMHVGACLDLLWELDSICKPGKDFKVLGFDDKKHPVSIIGEIAKFEHWKLLAISTAVLDWVEKLLGTDEWLQRNHRPSWILPKLLDPFFAATMEKHWIVGRKFHWTSVLVHLGNTARLRDRVLTLCRRLLARRDTLIALGVESVLKNAIEYARLGIHGEPPEAWKNQWIAERLKALGLLEELARDFSEPVIHFQVRHTLFRHIRYCDNRRFQEACRTVFNQVPDSFDLRVCRAVLGNAHTEFERPLQPDSHSWSQEIERRWDQFLAGVTDEVVTRFSTPEALLAQFQKWEEEFSLTDNRRDYSALVGSIAARHPALSLVVAELVIARPERPLDVVFDRLIFNATRECIQKRLRLCTAALATGASDLSRAAIWCIIWWRRETDLPSEAWDLMGSAAPSTDRKIAWAVTDFVWYSKSPSTQRDWNLLIQLHVEPDDTALADRIADCAVQLLEKDRERPSAQVVAEVLRKFDRLPLDAHGELQRSLSEISKAFPVAVFMLYWGRVQATGDGNRAPTPIPWDAEDMVCPGLLNDPEAAAIVRQLEGELYMEPGLSPERERLLRIAVFRGNDDPEAKLGELLDKAQSSNQLNHLMSLFASPVKSSVVTEYPSFVRGLLKKARTFGRETYDQIFLELHSHATSHPYSTSAGEPDTEWKKLLEAIERRTQEFSADPDLGQLYSQIADDERSRMEYMRGSERTALGME